MANLYSLQFNGSSQYGIILSSCIDPRNNYTIELWVKLNAEIASGTYEFLRLQNNTAKHVVYLMYEYNSGTRRLNFKQDRWLLAGASAYYTVNLGTTSWHHLAFQKSGTTLQIYFDGTAVGSTGTVDNNTGDTTTNNDVSFGAAEAIGGSAISNYANAKIDELRIWSVARTAQEIVDNKDKELTGSESNLVEYIKFYNGSGSTATATTGTNGTLTNNPVWSTDVPFIGTAGGIFFHNFL